MPEKGSAVISDEMWEIASEMVRAVNDEFRFDFSGDLELRMNLARHIGPLAIALNITCIWITHAVRYQDEVSVGLFDGSWHLAGAPSVILAASPLMKSSATSPWHLPWPSSGKQTSRVANAS